MQKRFTAITRKSVLLSLFVLGLIAALIVLPSQFNSEAGSKSLKKGLFERTESQVDGMTSARTKTMKP